MSIMETGQFPPFCKMPMEPLLPVDQDGCRGDSLEHIFDKNLGFKILSSQPIHSKGGINLDPIISLFRFSA
jgi:hypothetical protein